MYNFSPSCDKNKIIKNLTTITIALISKTIWFRLNENMLMLKVIQSFKTEITALFSTVFFHVFVVFKKNSSFRGRCCLPNKILGILPNL